MDVRNPLRAKRRAATAETPLRLTDRRCGESLRLAFAAAGCAVLATSAKQVLDAFRGHGHRLVLPDPNHFPAISRESKIRATVALNVAFELLAPPLPVGFRHHEVFRTPMPEAAVDEDCDALTRKHDVRLRPETCDGATVDPEP
jgi:hypothetical protein